METMQSAIERVIYEEKRISIQKEKQKLFWKLAEYGVDCASFQVAFAEARKMIRENDMPGMMLYNIGRKFPGAPFYLIGDLLHLAMESELNEF